MDPSYYHGFTTILAWIINWLWLSWIVKWSDLSIPKLQRCSHSSLGIDTAIHVTHYWAYDYASTLVLKLIHDEKISPLKRCQPFECRPNIHAREFDRCSCRCHGTWWYLVISKHNADNEVKYVFSKISLVFVSPHTSCVQFLSWWRHCKCDEIV